MVRPTTEMVRIIKPPYYERVHTLETEITQSFNRAIRSQSSCSMTFFARPFASLPFFWNLLPYRISSPSRQSREGNSHYNDHIGGFKIWFRISQSLYINAGG